MVFMLCLCFYYNNGCGVLSDFLVVNIMNLFLKFYFLFRVFKLYNCLIDSLIIKD